MKADTDAVLDELGTNELVKKVFRAFFIATSGLVLAQIVDPVTAESRVRTIAGIVPRIGRSIVRSQEKFRRIKS